MIPEPPTQNRVDSGGRLVEHQDAGVVNERGGQRDAALHAAGGRAHQLAVLAGEIDQVHQLVETPSPSKTDPVEGRVEVQVVAQRQVVEEHRMLREIADRGAIVRRKLGRRGAEYRDLARVGPIEAGGETDRRGLAATGRSDEPDDRSPRDREVDLAEDPFVIELLADATEGDGGPFLADRFDVEWRGVRHGGHASTKIRSTT